MSGGTFNANSIDAKLATIIANQEAKSRTEAEHHTAIISRLDEGAKIMQEHDTRLRSLEGSRKYVIGVFTTITTLLGLAEFFHSKK